MTGRDVGHVVVVGTEDPWASTTGGTVRTRALLAALEATGAEVTMVHPPSTPDGGSSRPSALSRFKRALLPLPTIVGARDSSMSGMVDDLRASAAIVVATTLSTAQYWGRSTDARLWMEYSDVWSEFALRESRHRRGVPRLSAWLQAAHLRRLEHRYDAAAAIVTTAGLSDHDVLVERGVRATWLPTPITAAPDAVAGAGGTRTAGFIGNFAFHPNRDALDVLVETWGPELVRRGWRVAIAGRGSESLSMPDWITNLGSPESVAEFYKQIDLALAPIRLGGGMKVKIVEALLHGRPVVASEFAMAGFPSELRELVSVTDLAAPTFPTPDRPTPTWSPDHPALAPFTRATFDRTVAELVTGAIR